MARLFFMAIEKKPRSGLFYFFVHVVLEAQFYDFSGFFGNFDQLADEKKENPRTPVLFFFICIAMKNNHAKQLVPNSQKPW